MGKVGAAHIAQREPNFLKNLQIFEELYSHARSLGRWRLDYGLDGFEVTLKIARVVNTSLEVPFLQRFDDLTRSR